MSAATRRRLVPRVGSGGRRRRLRRPRIGPRAVAALLAVVAILVCGFFWVRQSSLVAVRTVTITGVSGPDASQIRTALTGAARGMSTLAVDRRRLRTAVSAYPIVRGLHLHAQFPHRLRIAVSEQVPVAVLVAGSTRTTVASDGTLLRTADATSPLPTISVPVVPGATHVTGATATDVALLAAAPYPLLARLASAGQIAGRGLVATLRAGPAIEFGADSQLPAKWRAAVAVLASPTSAGASYIDVTDPARPAAGAGSDTSTATSPGTTPPGGAPSPSLTATAPSGATTSTAPGASGQTATTSPSSTG